MAKKTSTVDKDSADYKPPIRAFLQRAEVRLSTMHRICSAFIGGARLLILFPIFIKEAFTGIMYPFIELAKVNVHPA